MDKRKLLLLKYLLHNCSEGYKVLEVNKLLTAVKRYKGSFKSLEEDIMFLKQRMYIDLKYIDNDNVCLSIMDNSRIFEENIKIERNLSKNMCIYMITTMFLSGILSFLGALVATLILR